MLREMMFAALFGGSRWMDCFYLAFRVPNLLRDLFAEGALSQAFVTTFSKKLKAEGEVSAGSGGRAVKKALKEKRVTEVQPEAVGQLDLELRELQVLRAKWEPLAPLAPRVPRGQPVPWVLRVPRAPWALLAPLAPPAHRVRPEPV